MNVAMRSINYKIPLISFFVILYIVVSLISANIIIDDSFITFKYAKNLAEHFKPWYNLDPTFQGNGQTSLIWMWILAFFNFWGIKSENIFLAINLLAGSFLIIRLLQHLKFDKNDWLLNLFNSSIALFFTFWIYLNSAHGLESIFAALILYLFIKNWDQALNYFAILLPLIRPEFILFLLFWNLNSRFFSKDFYRKTLISVTAIFIFVSYYLIFFDYYVLLPLLYKSSLTHYTFSKISVYCGLLLIFIPILLELAYRKNFLLFIPLNILIFYYTNNVESYSSGIFSRYYFPLMCVYMVYDFNPENFGSISKKAVLFLKILSFLVILRMVKLSYNFYQQKKQIEIENVGYYGAYKNLVNTLKIHDRITITDAGYTAYFSQATCYDGAGLNDATLMLTRKNNDPNAYRNYIIERKINLVTVCSISRADFKARSKPEQFIYNALRLKKYQPHKIYNMDKGFYLFVYKFDGGYTNN
ncbi:hypothetical protein [Chryseobacterium sp. SC28]|uniref:hypothetical protein n=1 Tax=Chryseobacterium sp. SC28 TaxID=2268028 RepID=UPI000F9B77F9|nr:hypothetical protein [Chryseobacterium sp. SC28]RRQ47055.1 hypothetical protein DTW91_02425 [Chryseobacterium sp. SC28]